MRMHGTAPKKACIVIGLQITKRINQERLVKDCAFKLAIFLILLPYMLIAEISMRAEVDQKMGYENSPLSGSILIGHQADEEIDQSSFELDKKPLKVELVKQERLGADEKHLLSIYQFTLPAQAKGAHLLPAITVSVGGQKYQSIPSTYEVIGQEKATATKATPASAPASANLPILQLEAFIKGPREIFPGQKTTVGYRYIFTGNIDTTKEEVPLLKAEGLIKIGEPTAKELQEGQYSILEISQIVQGDKPGSYTYAPSILEGIPYTETPSGQKMYDSKKLTSTAEPITITVKPFPTEGQPTSFTGAVGEYAWKADLASPAEIKVGDPLKVRFTVSGSQDLQAIKLPELCCQPGMSGLFRLSDLPPESQTDGKQRTFLVEMRALSDQIKAIPAFEFSSFDPDTGQYLIYHTDPLPIKISPLEQADVPAEELPSPIDTQWQEQINQTEPLEVQGYEQLHPYDLQNKYFGTWWSLFIIPFGMGFMMFQNNVVNLLASRRQVAKTKTSAEIFAQGERAPDGSVEQLSYWQQAFLLRLHEKKYIAQINTPLEHLSKEGLIGQVRAFLLDMQKDRYSAESGLHKRTSRKAEAKDLFNSIQEQK